MEELTHIDTGAVVISTSYLAPASRGHQAATNAPVEPSACPRSAGAEKQQIYEELEVFLQVIVYSSNCK